MSYLHPLAAMSIVEVPAGTEIEKDGERLTVTDCSIVLRGREMFMTPSNYSTLKHNEKVTQL